MWKIFKILGYDVGMKIYENPSHMGVFGSRISKLVVDKNDHCLLWFDRGEWLEKELPEKSIRLLIATLEHLF